jgi:hypothetical protein
VARGYGGVLYSALQLKIFSAKLLRMNNFFLDEEKLEGISEIPDL